MSKGVDWNYYVKMRNIERMVNEQKKDDAGMNLLDEEDYKNTEEENKISIIEN